MTKALRVLVPFGVLVTLVLFSCYHGSPPTPCDPSQLNIQPCNPFPIETSAYRDAGTQ